MFSPFFAAVAAEHFLGQGLDSEGRQGAGADRVVDVPDHWTGLIIGFGAPFMGALADITGRRLALDHDVFADVCGGMPGACWYMDPDGQQPCGGC